MIEAIIAELLQGKIKPPSTPQNLIAKIPENDDQEFEQQPLHDEETARNLAFWISYEKPDGEISERDILIKSVFKSVEGHLLACAFCYQRKAIRSFRVDRIKDMYWLDTGEVINQPRGLLEGLLTPSSTVAIISNLQPCLNLLAFIARADGHFHPEEVEIISDFVEWQSGTQIDRDELKQHIRALYPSEIALHASLRRLKSWPNHDIPLIKRYIQRVIDADEKIDPTEFNWIIRIRDILPRLAY